MVKGEGDEGDGNIRAAVGSKTRARAVGETRPTGGSGERESGVQFPLVWGRGEGWGDMVDGGGAWRKYMIKESTGLGYREGGADCHRKISGPYGEGGRGGRSGMYSAGGKWGKQQAGNVLLF